KDAKTPYAKRSTTRERTSIQGCRRFRLCRAEDGIRVSSVTGVQTCALPILAVELAGAQLHRQGVAGAAPRQARRLWRQGAVARGIGRASGRERGRRTELAAGMKRLKRGTPPWGRELTMYPL